LTALPLAPEAAGLRVTLSNFLRGDYARGFFTGLAIRALAVIILIEAIFLAEHFTWVFRDAVRHEADLAGIALVLLCTSTEIFDLALAVAILMASYLILLRMRENRELLVLFASVWGLMQFLSSPVLGALSDRFGRRPVILLSCLGLSMDHVFMALAPTIELLLVGRIISGITSATISTARAYVADVSAPEQRARAFGFVGMSFGIGFVLGPAIGGFLGDVDPRLPFWVSAAASLANALFGWFVLPESLPPERRMAFSWKRANPMGALRLLLSRRELPSLATIHFLITLVQQVLPAVFVLYTAHRYSWDGRTMTCVCW